MEKHKNKIKLAIIGSVFLALTLGSWFFPTKDFSISERRPLATRPTASYQEVFDGSFMKNFDKFTLDQFPMRDLMRKIKAVTTYYGLGQLDNHGIYMKDGYIAKLEYPLDQKSIDHAAGRFEYIYKNYLEGKNTKVYLSVVPDKNYFLAKNCGYPSMDYEKLVERVREKMKYAGYIDVFDTLDVTDYYKTDTHWRQEKIVDTAEVLASSMEAKISGKYEKKLLDVPFLGVYYGQSGLPLKGEDLYYLTNDVIDGCVVNNMEDGTVGGVYDMDKAYDKDPYEMFLSGPKSLMVIDNPKAKSDKELVVFRDSFGSSIGPLLAEGYRKVTLVDIRYLRADFVGNFVDFDGQDVLFLYSGAVLNNSETLM